MANTLPKDFGSFLLLLALVLFLIIPIPITFFPEYFKLIFASIYSILIFVGIGSVTSHHKHRLIGYALGLMSLILVWINTMSDNAGFIPSAQTFSLFLFFSYLAFHLFKRIALNKEITLDIIFSSISGYLIIGLIGGTLFQLLEISNSESFNLLSENNNLYDLHYLSFVTLTTLGYGDVLPTTEAAKSLTVFIALAGQLYLTILIAILVGKYLSKN